VKIAKLKLEHYLQKPLENFGNRLSSIDVELCGGGMISPKSLSNCNSIEVLTKKHE
jgi:hypothetical protein